MEFANHDVLVLRRPILQRHGFVVETRRRRPQRTDGQQQFPGRGSGYALVDPRRHLAIEQEGVAVVAEVTAWPGTWRTNS